LAKIRNKSKKNYKSQGISFSLIEVIIVIMISILFGGLVGSLVTLSRGNVTDEYLEEFYATYNDIVSDYYKKLDKNKLIDAAIEGMVNYLDDPYSTFMNSEETEDFNTTVNGEYKGIGITIGMVNEKPTVVDMFDKSPAQKVGVKVGDIILKINDKSVDGKSLDEIVELIKNKSKVKLVVARDSKEYDFTVKLDDVVIPSVVGEVIEKDDKKIGKMSI